MTTPPTQKIYTFHVHGMTCEACVLLLELELKHHQKVTSAQGSLKTQSVVVSGDFGDLTSEAVAVELTRMLSKYSLSTTKPAVSISWQEFAYAIPIALGFALLFIALQKLGIVNLVQTSNVTYGTAFVIGIIASLSTCMAVVGGIVLSLSATFARGGDTVKPQMLFHVGRVVSFFVLGGVIGMVGAVFQFGIIGSVVLGLFMGLVMLVLGINLLDVFRWSKRLQPSMPKFLSRRVMFVTMFNHTATPALVGAVTFFLPCGFTQSMQIYALSTGSFLRGALTMFAFSLGTFPVLALVSFSSFRITSRSWSGIFFKSAGIIVMIFAVFTILNTLAAAGWIQPVFRF